MKRTLLGLALLVFLVLTVWLTTSSCDVQRVTVGKVLTVGDRCR